MEEEFVQGVDDAIGVYVYRLVDPRNGETFYVGQGQGNRIFVHARGVIVAAPQLAHGVEEEPTDGDRQSLKLRRIQEIRNSGLQVLHIVHRHGLTAEAANEVEAALIDAYPGLTNIQGGIGSGARGTMHAHQINTNYGLPTLTLGDIGDDRLILINVNGIENLADQDAIYQRVRFAWRINPERAAGADNVLAVRQGVVIGAFTVQKWLPATPRNFPDFPDADPETARSGFLGAPADVNTWERFTGQQGKRVVIPGMRHVRYPVRYWNC